MSTYHSNSENNWYKPISVELTSSQKELLRSRNTEDVEDKENLLKYINENNKEDITGVKLSELNSFYESKKPELEQEDTYEFISMDVSEKKQGVYNGILNCRVNDTHKQIRF